MAAYVNSKPAQQSINYDRWGARHKRRKRVRACVCVCECVPLDLNPSHIPAFSLMGQQVSRSLTTLPVLFWPSWLRQRGCQSSQPFLFPYETHTSTASVAQATVVFFIIFQWYEQIQFAVRFYTRAVVFISLFCAILRTFYVSSLVFWTSPLVDQPENSVFTPMTLLADASWEFSWLIFVHI